jgi:hypothetical protein
VPGCIDVRGVDDAAVRTVLKSWGLESTTPSWTRMARPFGRTASRPRPCCRPAFGLAGVNLHTYTGWESVPYWNAYVVNTQMHGQGTFFEPRLRNT